MESFEKLQAHQGSLAVSLGLILVTAVLVRAYDILIGRPLRTLRKLQSQGLPGYPFFPVFGQIFTFLEIDKKREADPAFAEASGGTNVIALRSQLRGDDKEPPHLWTFGLGTTICIAVSDPDIVRHVCMTHNDSFCKPAFVKRALWLLGNGLSMSDGPLWERQRRLISPSFSMREVRRYIPLIVKRAKEAVEGWKALLVQRKQSPGEGAEEQGRPGQPQALMMNTELASLTLDVVFRAVFGTKVDQVLSPERVKVLQTALARQVTASMQAEGICFLIPFCRYLPTGLNKTVRDSARIVKEDLHRLISHRLRAREAISQKGKDNNQPDDLLDILIDATDDVTLEADKIGSSEGRGKEASRKPTVEGGGKMTVQQLRDECSTFLASGSETTGNLLTWTVLLLSQNPEWQEKARQEAVSLSKSWGKEPTLEDLNEMKVVTCVLYEALRLMPSLPAIARTAIKDTWLTKDLFVPKGCDIYILIQVMQRCKEYWGPDADKFNPERFANGTGSASLHPGAYMPFSSGPRNCVGQNFAMVEAKIILGALLENFSWTVADSYVHQPEALVTMQAKHGLPVNLQPLS